MAEKLKKINISPTLAYMRILGIETSCDETGVAIIEATGTTITILADEIASQIDIHQQYGGVYPALAKRAHQENLPLVLNAALQKAGLSHTSIDAIAITYGPGLAPCLWAGITFVQQLASEWNIPVIPINHIEAHLLVGLLEQTNNTLSIPDFAALLPAIAVLVSGGHTQLVFAERIGKYRIIGETRDDAAGEAFDKTARILGLPYPGGPAIAQQAENAKAKKPTLTISLPRPMIHSNDYDFSFSGLKTAVLYDYKARPEHVRTSQEYIQAMALEIQQAIIDVIIKKVKKAITEYRVKTLILGGGVAANSELRQQLETHFSNVALRIPSPTLATDNGVMAAVAGYFNKEHPSQNITLLEAKPNLRVE